MNIRYDSEVYAISTRLLFKPIVIELGPARIRTWVCGVKVHGDNPYTTRPRTVGPYVTSTMSYKDARH